MKIIRQFNKENGDVFETVIVENVIDGYENILIQPLIEHNNDDNITYLIKDDNYVPYCYVSDIG